MGSRGGIGCERVLIGYCRVDAQKVCWLFAEKERVHGLADKQGQTLEQSVTKDVSLSNAGGGRRLDSWRRVACRWVGVAKQGEVSKVCALLRVTCYLYVECVCVV